MKSVSRVIKTLFGFSKEFTAKYFERTQSFNRFDYKFKLCGSE